MNLQLQNSTSINAGVRADHFIETTLYKLGRPRQVVVAAQSGGRLRRPLVKLCNFLRSHLVSRCRQPLNEDDVNTPIGQREVSGGTRYRTHIYWYQRDAHMETRRTGKSHRQSNLLWHGLAFGHFFRWPVRKYLPTVYFRDASVFLQQSTSTPLREQ